VTIKYTIRISTLETKIKNAIKDGSSHRIIVRFDYVIKKFILPSVKSLTEFSLTRLFYNLIQGKHIYLMNSTLVTPLLKDGLIDDYDLSSLESVTCNAVPLRKEVEDAFKNKLKLKYVQQLYGLTETLISTVKSIKNTKSGTSGSPIPGIQIKVNFQRIFM